MDTLWTRTAPPPEAYPSLAGDLDVDVAVIGAGIAGLTSAVLLKQAGRKVAVLEAAGVAGGESSATSAHLTAVQDSRFYEIASRFGVDGARRIASAGMAAIAELERLAGEYGIDCDFARVPGYLYCESEQDLEELEREARAAANIGLVAELIEAAPLPFPTRAALRFANQGIFHPRKYLLGLAAVISGEGCQVYVNTRALDVRDGRPCEVQTASGTVRAHDVVVATDTPLNNRGLLTTKIAPYRTYIVTAKLASPLPGVFWDTAEPYHYLRSWQGPSGPVLIAGGEDHRVGEVEDTRAHLHRLEAWVRRHFGADIEIEDAWSGQIEEPVDGLPFIGATHLARHVYVATGFSGTGLANGTLAGRVLSDTILGRTNPWASTVAANRVKPLASARRFITENLDFPKHLLKDRMPAQEHTAEEVQRGEGRIVSAGGEKLALYRDHDGVAHALSPVCPHLGCHVHWNNAESSWDCPCHGSRFSAVGAVMHGPAVRDLSPRELPQQRREAPGAPSEMGETSS